MRSTDNGFNWTVINTGLTDQNIRSLAINSNNQIFAGTFDGVFMSANNGNSWTQTGLTNISVLALAINSEGSIFAGTNNGGVFRSDDNGVNWIAINSGLNSSFIRSFTITPDEHIFAGTNSDGIYRSINNTTAIDGNSEIRAESYSLNQNYPNPFNPKTTINYSVPDLSKVVIKVYDVLGKEVAALVNEEKPAGTYEVEFNASKLVSGVYFYKIQAGNFVETKKMILIK